VQLDHVVAGRWLQDAAQTRGAEVEPAPLLLEIGVLVVDLMQAALRVSARFGKVMLNRAEAAKIVSDR
jgi:hypothetical protein